MSSETKPYATVKEFEQFVEEVKANRRFPYPLEWTFAVEEGWDWAVYQDKFAAYVLSTQVDLQPDDDKTDLKGKPLEDILRYFLEKGGFAHDIRELSAPSRWQVDGVGLLNRTATVMCWGKDLSSVCSPHIYMEAKNHIAAATNDEFSLHCQRMRLHGCNVGVFASTSGFRIGRGEGIARDIYNLYLKDEIHLLLVFESFRSVIEESKAPLVVLSDVLTYAMNEEYENSVALQQRYSEAACHELAMQTHLELSAEQPS
jgi:hypothetical protein